MRSLRKTRTMKALIPIAMLFLIACANEPEIEQINPLQAEKEQLNQSLVNAQHNLAEREAYLAKLNDQMDALLPKLDLATNTEEKVELQKKMEFIGERISAYENSVAQLQSALKTEERKAREVKDDLQVAMDALADQEAEIELLVFELQNDGEHIAELQRHLDELEMRENITAKINAERLVAIGSKDELVEEGLIARKGLPLFRRTELKLDEAKNVDWKTIDMRAVNRIPMYSKEASVHSEHPNTSFDFSADEEGMLTLEINDPMEFWSLSKCLVIEIE